MSGRLQLWDWLFLSLQKACDCAKCNCLPTCLIAYLSLAWYRTAWKLSDNGWARAFALPLGKHLSAVMYSPKFSKQDDKEGNRIKRRKLVCGCQKAGWTEIVASSANQCLNWQLFSVWTVWMHLAGRLGHVLRVEWLQSHFCCRTLVCSTTVSKNGRVRNHKALLGSLEILTSRWLLYYLYNWALYWLY